MNKLSVLLIASLLMVFSLGGLALAENYLPKPMAPTSAVAGPAGTGFPVGKLASVLNYRFIETEGIFWHDDKMNENVKLTKHIGLLKFRYGISPGFDIRSGTPFYDIEKENRISGATDNFGWIGDTTLILHKVLMTQKKGNLLNVAIDLGGIIPTANTDNNNLDYIGNGAWGVFTGIGFTYFLNSHRFDQEFNFASFTEGSHDYRKPNRVRSNTSWAYAFNEFLDIGIESNFEWNGDSKKNGIDQYDSKREWYAGPKVVFKYKPSGFNVGLLTTFPVKRWYETNSPSDEYRVDLKLTKAFDLF